MSSTERPEGLAARLEAQAGEMDGWGKTWRDLAADLREAADALRRQEEALRWRPIDTAPKDGTPVLLWRETVYAARWLRSEEMGPVWATPNGHVIFRATHWMPPPAPPALTPESPTLEER